MAAMPSKARKGRFANPRMMLHEVEHRMAGIRKVLAAKTDGSCSPGKWEDAVKLTSFIERMAQAGQCASAEDSTKIAELVEVLLDDLRAKLRSILARP